MLVAAFLAFLALLSAAVGALTALLAFESARYPYNSEGRYFDGVAVHHDGAQFVYGALALAALAGAAGAAWGAYRLAKPIARSRRNPPRGAA